MNFFIKSLTLLLLLPMLFTCVPAYADTVEQKPVAVDADSIRVNDAISGEKNRVTMSWKQVSGVRGYEVTVAEQGKSDEKNKYTEIHDDYEKNIYNGSDCKLALELNRNYEYRFRIRSYDANGNYSDWTDRYYFTAVTPKKSAHSSAVEIGKNIGGKNVTVKNNVIKLKKNITVKNYGLGSTSDKVVLDLAGHKLNIPASLDEFIINGTNTVVIQDSVGGGVLNSKAELQWLRCKNLVINDGVFPSNIFSVQCLNSSKKNTVSIINAGDFKGETKWAHEKNIVNAGIFEKEFETSYNKQLTINNGLFKAGMQSWDDNAVINGGSFNASVWFNDGNKATLNGGTYSELNFDNKAAVINGGTFKKIYSMGESMTINNGIFNDNISLQTSQTTINGGYFTSTVDFYSAKATINGGTFVYTRHDVEDTLKFIDAFTGSDLTIKGGTFVVSEDMNVTDPDDWKTNWVNYEAYEDGTLNITGKISWNEDRTAIIVG